MSFRSWRAVGIAIVAVAPIAAGTHAQRVPFATGAEAGDRAAAKPTASLGAEPCNVQTRGFSMDIVHSEVLQVVVDVGFCAPVSLDGVSMVVFDTLVAEITSTSAVSQNFSFTVELLAAGEPVVALAPASGSQSGSLTSRRNFILRSTAAIPGGTAVDGIRLSSTVSATSLSVRYRGAYANNAVRAHFARGSFDEGDCHDVRSFTGTMPVTLSGEGTSPWVEQPFEAPVTLADAHFVWASRPGFSISGASGDSFDIESQLLLDDEQMLQMDNWSIPGASEPPADASVWAREVRRTVTFPECLVLAERSVTGWRWRVHKSGIGNLTITPGDPMHLWFIRKPCAKPGDLNDDGAVDVLDLLMLLAAWGDCPDPENCPPDLNGDCTVDVLDLLMLLAGWG